MEEICGQYFNEILDENGILKDITISYSSNFNFSYDILDEIAKKFPRKIAVVWCDSEGNEKIITFREMSELSNRAANFFVSRGVGRGDFVMLLLKRRFEYWYILNALHKIGAVVVPGTHMLTSEDLCYRINFAKIKTIVFTTGFGVLEKVLNVFDRCDSLINMFSIDESPDGIENMTDKLDSFSCDFKRVKTNVHDAMLAYFTSGTTGQPKLVKHSFSYPLGHFITAKYWQNARPDRLHLTVSDTGWGKAAWGKIYGQWMVLAPVMVYDYDNFVVDDLLAIIEKYKVKTFCAPPTIYRFFIKEGFGKHDISCLEYVTTAGEALDVEIIKKFKEATGLQIMEAFGQTETVAILISQVNSNAKLGSLGKPSPLYDVLLLDKNCKNVDVGEVGEICVKLKSDCYQVGLFLEYHNDFNLNKFSKRGGIYHTGDMAFCDEDGYFWYVGRLDDIIKSSGYRIGPFEVESVLIEHPAVLECGVVGVFDELRGQIIKAVVVLASDYVPSEELKKELQLFVKNKTAPYKYPRIIEFVDELPKTISGKVKRNMLRMGQ